MSSPGVGGTTVGSHLKPEVYQQEATAANEGAKQSSLIVKDSLQLSFADMKEQHFQYKNDPKRPMLPMYVQVTVSRQDKPDQPWVKAFGQLARSLPDKLQKQLAEQLKLPPNKRDPRFQGLIEGLQFAAKGLQWLREAKKQNYTLSDKEKREHEERRIEESMGFYKEMLGSFIKVVTSLPANTRERPTLMQMTKNIPRILSLIGSKREKRLGRKQLELTDKKVLSEIDEVRSHVKKNLGDRPLLVPDYLLNYLEVLHQLSYPGLQIELFRTLLIEHEALCKTASEFGLIGLQVGKISKAILSLHGETVFDKERETLINILTGVGLALFSQGATKQDFGYRLILTIVVASRFLSRMGQKMLQGLLYSKEEAQSVGDAIFGTALGGIFLMTDVNELKREEKEELYFTLRKPLLQLCKRMIEHAKEKKELSLALRKLAQHIEEDNIALVYQELHRMVESFGLDGEKLAQDLKAISAFIRVVQGEIGEFQKEEQKLNLLQRPA